MLRDDLEDELEVENARKDVEVTLGPAVLFAIVCGLILLCGLCFGVGYTSGRRSGARTASAKEAASGQTLAAQQAAAAAHKPGAGGTPPAAQAAASAAAAQNDSSSNPAAGGGPNQAAQPNTPAVRPAIPSQPTSSAAGGAPTQVQPAIPPGSGVMVQVAAVSHVEDANVLMGALKKRGYEVTARREPDDNLIHVQIGPFANRAEANAMSQRLLSDGYNAVVLP